MWNDKSTLPLWVSQAVNGFHALAQEDSNLDGRVDAQDSRYASLSIWRDLNQNGISEADELLTLPSAGIQALLIESEPNYQLPDIGNVLADVGQKASDGFAALRDLDSNGDGRFTAADAHHAVLNIWRDLNQDGLSQAGELQTLGETGIAAINLNPATATTNLGNGNQIIANGSYTSADGTARTAANLNLAQNLFWREYTDRTFVQIALTEVVLSLPDMKASGQVRDLREAASLSPELADLLAQYAAAPDRAGQRALLDPLLEAWAGTSEMATTAWIDWQRIVMQDAGGDTSGMVQVTRMLPEQLIGLSQEQWKKLTLLERFNGRLADFLSGLHMNYTTTGLSAYGGQIALLDQAYGRLAGSVYGSLLLQTRLKPYLDQAELVLDETGLRLDFGAVETYALGRAEENLDDTVADLLDAWRYAGQAVEGMGWKPVETLGQVLDAGTPTAETEALLAEESITWIGQGTTDYTVGVSGTAIVLGNGLGSGDSLNGIQAKGVAPFRKIHITKAILKGSRYPSSVAANQHGWPMAA